MVLCHTRFRQEASYVLCQSLRDFTETNIIECISTNLLSRHGLSQPSQTSDNGLNLNPQAALQKPLRRLHQSYLAALSG